MVLVHFKFCLKFNELPVVLELDFLTVQVRLKLVVNDLSDGVGLRDLSNCCGVALFGVQFSATTVECMKFLYFIFLII